MNLPRQLGNDTCWAACIELLQDLASVSRWHHWCIADRAVIAYPPCVHSLPESAHDVALPGADFDGEAGRCSIHVAATGTSEQDILDALRDGVAPILGNAHYQVVLKECESDTWCIYDPTFADVWEESRTITLGRLDQAWAMVCVTLDIEGCCDA